MNKDSQLIFESYQKSLLKENKLKYDYEIVAYLPRDIDISTREGQDKVLSLAHKELVKRVTNKYKNPERAASNMFYDEDFPMELVSQYSHYQKHGFPDVEENAEEEGELMTHMKDRGMISKDAKVTLPKHETEEEEDAQNAVQTYIYLDLYTGKTTIIPRNEFQEAIEGLEKVKGRLTVYRGEEYMVLVVPSASGSPSEGEEMPTNQFMNLKQFINKGPIKIKKPSKELPSTHSKIHDLAKQDSREGQKEENAEDKNTSQVVDYFRRTFGPGYKEEMEKNKMDPYEFFVDYYAWMRNYDPKILSNFAEIYNSQYPEHKVDTKKLLDMFSAIRDVPMKGYQAPGKKSENEERRLDPKCWKGYHKAGTKLKGGVRVNKCVKN
ncbi:MAG: hypothetical protein EBU90_26125 [Proteobacteria bacterium]|nr:hypothetical protein [Pseudomonadota bacterium]